MKFDIIVVGSGPGGYVAAIRAAQLGLKTAVVERAELGGICLNWGCVPTKALLRSAQIAEYARHASDFGINVGDVTPDIEKVVERSRNVSATMSKGINYLLKKNKIEVFKGHAMLTKDKEVAVCVDDGTSTVLTAPHVILATGARSRELATMPIDGKKIIGYREALVPKSIPASMVVVGSGAIGSELAYFYNSMGTSVTIVEFMPDVVPIEDKDISANLNRAFRKAGIKVMVNSAVQSVDTSADLCRVTIKTKKGEEIIECEVVLSAVGITPNIENIGLENLGVALDRGRIVADEYYRTNIDGIYAIGDIINTPALAHVASAEAIVCVEKIAGLDPKPIDYTCIPSCVYTTPEVASVGMTEKAAADGGYQVRIGKFPFTASGKATAAGERDGFVKLVFDAETDKLIGAHLIGYNVTEMITELTLAYKLGATGKQIISTIHPHPTMSEAVMEAAAAAHGEVIHL